MRSCGPNMYDDYYMLKNIKTELTSGPKTGSESDLETDDLLMTLKSIPEPKRQQKGRRRSSKKRNSIQQSDSECSMADSQSTVSSDSELAPSSISDESESEADPIPMSSASDVTEDETSGSSGDEAALLFRHHLQGLYGVLKHLTNNAQHVTNKYQEEIGELSGNNSNMSQLSTFRL